MRLVAGILVDAARCFQRNFETRRPSRRQEFREAQFWIFDKGNGPFSFQCVCESLEIDPYILMDWIVHWQKDRRCGDKQRMIRLSLRSNLPAAYRRTFGTLHEIRRPRSNTSHAVYLMEGSTD
jgi:hypothetical protein